MKKEETVKKRDTWKNFRRSVVYLTKESPGIFPMAVLVAILGAVYPYIGIFLSAEILTELADPGRSLRHLFFLALLLVGLNFIGRLLLSSCAQVLDVMKYAVLKHIELAVAEKSWTMDYAISAAPEINETKGRITRWHYYRGVLALVEQLGTLLETLITIGISLALVVEFFRAKAAGEGQMAALLNHRMISLLFLAVFALSVAYNIHAFSKIQNRYFQADEKAGTPMNQMLMMSDVSILQYQHGKDIRMFRAGGFLSRSMQSLSGSYAGILDDAFCYERKMSLFSTLLSRSFHLLVYLFVGLKAMYGAFGVGSILKYTGMVTQFGDAATRLFHIIREFRQNFEYIRVYFDYLDMPNLTAAGKLPVTRQIREDYEFEFKNVTFSYPGASLPSLCGISCSFRKGEKIAVVGRNGSGKTTFIKLLCRLCDPQEGEILLNGTDIRKFQYEEYLEFFSTVFQDYSIFAFELGENVASESDYDEKKAVQSLEDAGFGDRLKTLDQGLHTQINKNFSEDGVELSGGESQKVAIARCLYKDAPFVVLDEPTAALDPVAEADIYQRMNQFASGKGAIYISHRLSSCRFCDRILVFEEGRLAEQGTHEDLLAAEGLYRKLWDAQAKYYA